jgi:lariat debranching enzyme
MLFECSYYGGWAAPNIYFLGYSGVVNYGGLRIGGFSGIFKGYDFKKGHFEVPPYTQDTIKSAFHVREYELYKLSLLRQPLDVIISHDWPNITSYGNAKKLYSNSGWKEQIERGELGCNHYTKLLKFLKPTYWLSGHMHCWFDADVPHQDGSSTRFIALDKVLPDRPFLDVLDFPQASGPRVLTYDREWIAVLKASHQYFNLTNRNTAIPSRVDREYRKIDEELRELKIDLVVPQNFAMTVEPHRSSINPRMERASWSGRFVVSHQTEEFMKLVGLSDIDGATPSAPPTQSGCGQPIQ